MVGEDAFLTVAEFAVALAGFTSVVVAFSRRGGEWAPVDRFRIQLALVASLGAAFFALLPSCLHLLGASGTIIWRIASGLLAAHIAASIGWGLSALRSLDAEARALLGTTNLRLLPGAASAVIVLEVLNALGVGFSPQPGVFFVGLLHQLGMAVFGFVRTIFLRPR